MTGAAMLEDAPLPTAGHCPVDRPVRLLSPKRAHLDLFSGIGGFALAAKWTGFETVGFCEIDPACRRVLEKHWPGVPKHEDVRELNGSTYRGVDLLTGGFPCQPFSTAGLQRGASDRRHLWPDMLRIVREARPRWVLCENVVGFIRLGLDAVLSDLEAEGYACWPTVVPASAVGAPHERKRVWIAAHRADAQQDFAARQDWQSDQRPESWWPELRAGGHPRTTALRYNGRVDDGLRNRLDRVKMLGNAIVPMVAYQMLRALVRPNRRYPSRLQVRRQL